MRKKLPLISGILNVLEKLKGNTGIIENTSVATHTIAAGKYVIWKNDLYKASSAISIGDTLSLSNLTAVSDGIANELNSKIHHYQKTITNQSIPANSVSYISISDLNIPDSYIPIGSSFVEPSTGNATIGPVMGFTPSNGVYAVTRLANYYTSDQTANGVLHLYFVMI